MNINKVLNILESWMPKAISEDFDNVGLIIGNSSQELQNILVTLDSTVDVIEEAIEKNCNLIISYHPIIFEGIKKINEQEDYVQKAVIKAIENKICIYAIHTSMDNHENGISYSLAKILGLNKTSILIPKVNTYLYIILNYVLMLIIVILINNCFIIHMLQLLRIINDILVV